MASKSSAADDDAEGRGIEVGTSSRKQIRWAEDVVEPATADAKANNNYQLGNNDGQQSNHQNGNSTANIPNNNIINNGKPAAKAPLCSFCRKQPAAVVMKKNWKKGGEGEEQRQPLCLLHYYTTSAVHADAKYVKILDADLVEAQLKGGGKKTNTLHVQDLFAEAFVQLQQELAQESLTVPGAMANNHQTATTKTTKNPRRVSSENDPLSILHDLSRSRKRRSVPLVNPNNNNTTTASQQADQHKAAKEGGFLRPVPVPERLRRTQQQQAKVQAEQLARMNGAAHSTNSTNSATNNKNQHIDLSKRRQPTRRSIWDAVIRDNKNNPRPPLQTNKKRKTMQVPNNTFHDVDVSVTDVKCTCGSTNVSSAGNITSRNQDLTKGETWGMKDRMDDIVLRYRCNQCGKCWQESG